MAGAAEQTAIARSEFCSVPLTATRLERASRPIAERQFFAAVDIEAPPGIERLPWSALTVRDRAAWRRIRLERPQLISPFFSLGWHDAVNEARADVEVLRISQNGQATGFLPFCRSAFGTLRPVGAPMSDWHGYLGPAGSAVRASEVLRTADGKAFRFSGATADDPLFRSLASRSATSYVMDLSDGYEAYEDFARQAHPKAFRNLRSRVRKLHERRVEVRLDDRDPASLAKVLSMKRSQYRRTWQIDIFNFRWTRKLVETLFDRSSMTAPESVRGLLSTLWIDGEMAAGHFGLKDDATLHYWFPVYDARFAELSPGIVLLHLLARAAAPLGFNRVDLGDGDYRFKEEFANQHLPAIAGAARVDNLPQRGSFDTPSSPDRPARGFSGRLGRIPGAMKRRLDLLSTLHTFPTAKGSTAGDQYLIV